MTRIASIKTFLLVVVCSLILLACVPPPPEEPPGAQPEPTPGPLDIIRALDAALDQGDTDAALDLFVDEGLALGLEGHYAQDKTELRWIFDVWAGLDISGHEIRDCQSEGEQVTCTWYARDIWIKGQGLEAKHIPVTFRVQDQKILAASGHSVGEEERTRREGERKAADWIAANCPEEYWQVQNPAESGLTGREVGSMIADLIREYLEAMGE